MKFDATVGVVICVKQSPGVVKSGSAKDGIVTVATEFIATVTGANEVVPSVNQGGRFGTLTVIEYVVKAPSLSVKVTEIEVEVERRDIAVGENVSVLPENVIKEARLAVIVIECPSSSCFKGRL